MPRPTSVLQVGLAVLVAVAGLAPAAVAGLATANSTPATTDSHVLTAPDTQHALDAGGNDASDGDLDVRIELPKTIAANVTGSYSVDVSGAEGNVTATWTIDGPESNATRNGTTVQHAFEEGGNGTVSVTVSDTSSGSVTEVRAVAVVEYGSEDENGNGMDPLRAVGNFGMIFFGIVVVPLLLQFFVVPLLLLFFVVPKYMQVLSDAL